LYKTYSFAYICLSILYLDRIYRISRIVLPFTRSAGQAAERQKPISLFDRVNLPIKQNKEATWTFGNNTIGLFGFLFRWKWDGHFSVSSTLSAGQAGNFENYK
jgi:hypothetical protein